MGPRQQALLPHELLPVIPCPQIQRALGLIDRQSALALCKLLEALVEALPVVLIGGEGARRRLGTSGCPTLRLGERRRRRRDLEDEAKVQEFLPVDWLERAIEVVGVQLLKPRVQFGVGSRQSLVPSKVLLCLLEVRIPHGHGTRRRDGHSVHVVDGGIESNVE